MRLRPGHRGPLLPGSSRERARRGPTSRADSRRRAARTPRRRTRRRRRLLLRDPIRSTPRRPRAPLGTQVAASTGRSCPAAPRSSEATSGPRASSRGPCAVSRQTDPHDPPTADVVKKRKREVNDPPFPAEEKETGRGVGARGQRDEGWCALGQRSEQVGTVRRERFWGTREKGGRQDRYSLELGRKRATGPEGFEGGRERPPVWEKE